MPAPVDGFVSARLRMARAAQMLKQNDLADLVGRSPATISKWEQPDGQSPEAVMIAKLAEVLRVDPSWFFKPTLSPRSASFFRSRKSELRAVCAKFDARLFFVESIESTLSEYVDFPEVDIPDLIGYRRFDVLRSDDIEKIAMDAREYWDLGDDPIEDLLMVIENAGVTIGHDAAGSTKLDGLSRWGGNGRPYMLLAKDKDVGVRRRFDAAHELGHLILHRHVSQVEQQANFDLIENQAMIFAGAFLMPAETFGDDVYSLSLDALVSIKAKWKTSVAAMIMRLNEMGVVDDHYKRRLFQYYSARRWRGGEPLDDVLPVEQPHNLAEAMKLIIDGFDISPSALVREIGIHPQEISDLVGIDCDILVSSAPNITRLKPLPRKTKSVDQGEGNVVSLSDRRGNSGS